MTRISRVKSGRSARQEFVGAISAACITLFDSTGDCVFIESTATSVNPMFSLRPLLVAVLVVIAAGQDLPPPCDSISLLECIIIVAQDSLGNAYEGYVRL
uniref:Uncharacterized protein n=1 Tax=Timema genevievae TaxID=629358 RepID=A0A7R9JTS2_TIMGE|nr:unnamed protein product [Timema genevievae]